MVMINFTQSILSGKVDEGDVRSTSWLTAANIDSLEITFLKKIGSK